MSQSQIYDQYWTEGDHVGLEWEPEFFRESAGPLIGKTRVLDYGCGMGYSYQRQLVDAVSDYIGADISSVAVENARAKGLSAIFIEEDSTTGIDASSCDGAICSEVLEHLWDPLAAAKELHRVLKPGGILVATVPNFGYFPWRLQALLRARVPLEPESPANRYKGVHIRFFNRKLFSQLLLDAGFKEVKVHGWFGCRLLDIFWAMGPLAVISSWGRRNLPNFTFLSCWFPGLFAERLRAVAVK